MLISVTGQSIRVSCGEMLVSNSVGIYECAFSFSEDWDGWSKTAVFRSENGEPFEVLIIDGVAKIPHEVLESTGALTIGVYGTQDEKIKPVVWSENIIVRAGTPTGSPSSPPSPSVYASILEALNDKVSKGQGVENAGKYLKVGDDGNVYPAAGSTGGGAVDSVNGQTGAVTLTAEDVGALPEDTEIPDVPAWAMQEQKPAYTAQEVGAQPAGDYATSESVTALQEQIDALVSKSDVVDVVGTYAELQAYDTSSLLENDAVKVLDDSTHANGRSYYRWTDGAWSYIGTESVGYTKSETDTRLGEKQDTISDLETIREGAAAGATALQSIPVAGASLGGVKNGGNVTVNADGTMTAPSGGGASQKITLLADYDFRAEDEVNSFSWTVGDAESWDDIPADSGYDKIFIYADGNQGHTSETGVTNFGVNCKNLTSTYASNFQGRNNPFKNDQWKKGIFLELVGIERETSTKLSHIMMAWEPFNVKEAGLSSTDEIDKAKVENGKIKNIVAFNRSGTSYFVGKFKLFGFNC